MTGWTLFFTLVGVAFLTAQLFRLIDLIEAPPGQHRTPPHLTVDQILKSLFVSVDAVKRESKQWSAAAKSALQAHSHRKEVH